MISAPQCILTKTKKSKASITIETALVLPVCLIFVVCLMYLMEYVRINNVVSNSILKQTKKIASYGYTISKLSDNAMFDAFDATQEIITREYILSNINEDIIKMKSKFNLIVPSSLNLNNSSILNGNGKININVNFMLRTPFNNIGLPNIKCHQEFLTHAWVGYEDDFGSDDDIYVYITKSGTVYHQTPDCTYIHITPSSVPISSINDARNSSGGKYSPCEKCARNASITLNLYITPYGTKYHTDPNCSSINHEVKKVKLSSVGGRRPCSKCYSSSK